ncbi:MAG: YjfB family protein [Ectothiorhodospira sp.]
MDSSPIAALSTQLAQQQTAQSAQMSVAKKAMDNQAQTAAGLIKGMNESSAALPDHLGNHVNTTA